MYAALLIVYAARKVNVFFIQPLNHCFYTDQQSYLIVHKPSGGGRGSSLQTLWTDTLQVTMVIGEDDDGDDPENNYVIFQVTMLKMMT